MAEEPRAPRGAGTPKARQAPGVPKARQAKRDPMGKQALFWLPHESEPDRPRRPSRPGASVVRGMVARSTRGAARGRGNQTAQSTGPRQSATAARKSGASPGRNRSTTARAEVAAEEAALQTRPVGAHASAGALAPSESRDGGSLLSVVRELLMDMAGIRVRGKCESCGNTWTQDPLRFLVTRGFRCTISSRGLTPKGDCPACGAKRVVSFSLVPGSASKQG